MFLRILPGLLVALCTLSPALAELKPLDARLADYPYPHPVKMRAFQDQGQSLEMAYMDVMPEKPNGRTVLLLHGKNFSGAYWETTAKVLLEKGYRVVMPDQLGFGKSSKPTGFQYTFQDLATQTKGVLDDLKLEKVTVVGHSMGGMVAVRFALMFPERVEKLALVNPLGLEDWKRMTPYQPVDQAYAAEIKKGPDQIRDYMKIAYFDGKWQPEYEPLIELQAGWALGPDRETMARVSALTSEMIFTQPVVYEFPDLKVPALLIIGDRDRTAIGKAQASPEMAAKMGQYQTLGQKAADTIPGAKLVVIHGAGH
ncbi:MAG: alpha/beta hydrolase fold protein, partial [Akkermansiaceae bacterium]|nr:alpha/beta hydrolase fold protein [Akkermansiaceae bacterium]